MIENVTKIEQLGSDVFRAPEGQVLTMYKEGDKQIIYSRDVICKKGSELSDMFYLMDAEEAKRIDDVLRAEREKEMEERHHEFEHHMEPEMAEVVEEVETAADETAGDVEEIQDLKPEETEE